MEVRINREIREYTESIFFGLSLRQFFFSALACVVAVGTYFLLRPALGLEAVSWICILAAFPFAMIGFVKYNGMHAEKFLIVWVKTEILMPKRLTFGNTNLYYRIMQEAKEQQKTGKNGDKKRGKKYDKNIKQSSQTGSGKISYSKERAGCDPRANHIS